MSFVGRRRKREGPALVAKINKRMLDFRSLTYREGEKGGKVLKPW